MALSQLTSSDVGAGARAKINAGIAEADKVSGHDALLTSLQTSVSRLTLEKLDKVAGMYAPQRPGEAYFAFTNDTSVKAPELYLGLDPAKTETTAEGKGYRITSQETVVSKNFYYVDPTSVYHASCSFIRVSVADPSGDTLRFGLLCYDKNLTPLGASLTIKEWSAPTNGVLQASVGYLTRSGTPFDNVGALPAGTVYVRPYFQAFGGAQVTALLSLAWEGGIEAANTVESQAAAAGARQDRLVTQAAATAAAAFAAAAQAAAASGRVVKADKAALDAVVGNFPENASGVALGGTGVGEYYKLNGVWTYSGPTTGTLSNAIDVVDLRTADLDLKNGPNVNGWLEFSELHVDLANRPYAGWKADGSFWIQGLRSLNRVGVVQEDDWPGYSSWAWPLLDVNYRIFGGWKLDGSFWVIDEGGNLVRPGAGGGSGGPALTTPSYTDATISNIAFPFSDTTVYMFIVWGQSWAAGGVGASDTSSPVSTTAEHPGFALMFDVGVRPFQRAVNSFVDLREQAYGGSKETVCSRFAFTMEARLQATFNRRQKILMAICAEGGKPYLDIKRGTLAYNEILRLVTRAREIAAAQGLKLVVPAMIAIHGEQDFTDGTETEVYRRYLTQHRGFVSEDVRAITGQTVPVRMIANQVCWGPTNIYDIPKVQIAQLELIDADPLSTCAGPLYFAPEGGDASHPPSESYAQIGEMLADVAMQELYGPGFQPVRALEWWRVDSTHYRIRHNRSVTIDASDSIVRTAGLGSGLGFQFLDGSASPPAIASVAAVGGTGDTLEITLASAPAGQRIALQYAAYRNAIGTGNTRGPRGCVREPAPFMTSFTGAQLYHWAATQRLEF